MHTWDIILLIVGGFVAVMTLVRLMLRKRADLEQTQGQEAEETASEVESAPVAVDRSPDGTAGGKVA